ncbi:MAG: dihydropteroate synthase [Planctomycetes bacterium]|nr:dihydropteroate synthase [Planctomycetota bacterium]
MPTRILGILNLTRDSYSDGGRFMEPEVALQHARALRAAGAAMIDVGAQSTHPDAELVGVEEELRRLEPVVAALLAEGARVSVDTFEPLVMWRMLELGVHAINDVSALRTPGALEALSRARCEVILMHSSSSTARAETSARVSSDWIGRVRAFFEERITACERAGIARRRLILDPGMGLFLSSDPRPSFEVLRRLAELRDLGLPLCVGVSRKSFLGAELGRGVAERGAATLAAEMWCAQRGVEWLRTHDVRATSDALRTLAAIEGA